MQVRAFERYIPLTCTDQSATPKQIAYLTSLMLQGIIFVEC